MTMLLLISLIFMALAAVKWGPALVQPAIGEASNAEAEPRVKGMRMDCDCEDRYENGAGDLLPAPMTKDPALRAALCLFLIAGCLLAGWMPGSAAIVLAGD